MLMPKLIDYMTYYGGLYVLEKTVVPPVVNVRQVFKVAEKIILEMGLTGTRELCICKVGYGNEHSLS